MTCRLPDLAIRPMTKEDLPLALSIEKRLDAPDVWGERDFYRFLSGGDKAAFAAVRLRRRKGKEPLEELVGYALLHLRSPHDARLFHLAVKGCHRREGVGTELFARARDYALSRNRDVLCCVVREGNLPAQLFCRSNGLRCVTVLKGKRGFDCPPEDAYYFQHKRTAACERTTPPDEAAAPGAPSPAPTPAADSTECARDAGE